MSHNTTGKEYYGINKEAQEKLASKWNQKDADTCLKWISDLSGMELKGDFHSCLQNGVALCKALNRIKPGLVPKINTMNSPFFQRENVTAFIKGCKEYGVTESSLFSTVDLFDGTNLLAVVTTLFALGGVAQKQGFDGPAIGIRQPSANEAKPTSKFDVLPSGSADVPLQSLGTRDRNAEGAPEKSAEYIHRGR